MVCVVWLLTWISPLSAQTPDADLSKANELYDLKKYPEARDAFARWLAAYGVHPLRAVVMFNMGLAWEKEEKWDRALDAYKKSMEISQKGSAEFKDALYRAVFCYEKLGDWKSAKMSLGALEGYTLTTYRLAEFSIRKWYLDWLQSEKGAGPKPSLDDLEKNYQRFEKLRRTGVVPFDSLEIFARAALTLGRNKVSLLKTPKNKDEFETIHYR